ncbi:MAG: ATP-dependent DNA helicase [Candidatus Gracilibacteria bacterium]|nr:ATP-dependent DNA helicase [Candidatus Gracilibacteria bacterium]
MFKQEISKLNAEQLEAIEHIYGPCLVIAGPGTGKTQIIALRTANLLSQSSIGPENILITTFTEAGVASIKKRLLAFLGAESYKINVSTIHSFCNEIIQTYPEKFLKYKASNAIDELDQIEIFEKIIDESKLEFLVSDYDKYYFLPAIKDSISKLKQEGVGIKEFKLLIADQKLEHEVELSEIKPTLKKYETTKESQEKHVKKLEELNFVYEKYLNYLGENNLYDFSDMINFVLDALRKDQELKLNLAEKYQFIMLDEFQDTNNAQNLIIEEILGAGDDKNIFVVGDDDQSIYKFQGANLENMFHFSKKFEDTKIIVLKNNYRSTQEILDIASKSIANNKSRLVNFISSLEKVFISYKDELKKLKKDQKDTEEKGRVVFFSPKTQEEEKGIILQKIKNLIHSKVPFGEIAVITRTNREVEDWTSFLEKNEIRVESKIDTNILNSPFVEFLVDLINVVKDPFIHGEKTINVSRHPIFELEHLDVLKILRGLYNNNYTKTRKQRYFEALINSDFLESLELKNKEKIVSFCNLISVLGQSQSQNNFYYFFKELLERTGFVDYVDANGDLGDIEDVYTFSEIIKKWMENDREFNIEKFVKKISYYYKYKISIKRNVLKGSKEGVQVLTAHQSKGLEYDSVFVVGLCDGNWGNKRKFSLIKLPKLGLSKVIEEELQEDPKEKELEEERRLFFVAITRAKRNLSLSFPMSIEGKIKFQSQFLSELGLKEEKIDEIDPRSFVLNELKSALKLTAKISREEELYIKEFLKEYKLSPSDLNKFLEDPKLFLRDSIFKYPFEDNEFTIFGKVYHKTLEIFYSEFKNKGEIPTKKYIENVFLTLLSKQILTPEQEEKLKQKGTEGLDGWYENFGNKANIPLELEYNFYPKNVFFENIPITGKVDKVELIEEGTFGKNLVKLIDYKTGRTKSLNEIKGNTAKEEKNYLRQILFYKLLAENCSEFNKKYEISELCLEFVEGKDGKYSSIIVDYSEEELENLKQEIRVSREKINDMEFWREILEK